MILAGIISVAVIIGVIFFILNRRETNRRIYKQYCKAIQNLVDSLMAKQLGTYRPLWIWVRIPINHGRGVLGNQSTRSMRRPNGRRQALPRYQGILPSAKYYWRIHLENLTVEFQGPKAKQAMELFILWFWEEEGSLFYADSALDIDINLKEIKKATEDYKLTIVTKEQNHATNQPRYYFRFGVSILVRNYIDSLGIKRDF